MSYRPPYPVAHAFVVVIIAGIGGALVVAPFVAIVYALQALGL
jgi:hypothetical protein